MITIAIAVLAGVVGYLIGRMRAILEFEPVAVAYLELREQDEDPWAAIQREQSPWQ